MNLDCLVKWGHMTEKHPREETQQERNDAYTSLSNLIKRQILKYGTTYDSKDIDPGSLPSSVSVLTYKTSEEADIELTFATGISSDERGRFTAVGIMKLHDRHILGKQTDYLSINNGPFIRTDVDGKALGIGVSESAAKKDPLAAALLTELGGIALLWNSELNVQAGLDGFPITAQETNTLIEEITLGKPLPKLR